MIYTKTGDSGTTSLVGGSRVNKDDMRVEAYGTVDELNSHIGLLAEMMRPTAEEYYGQLKAVQHNLFTIQTLLATEDETIYARLPQLGEEEVATLERQIDTITDQLPKLHSFVIAGGNLAGAQCHVCRTVCRRAERRIDSLMETAKVGDDIVIYVNRLSDYLFVLAKKINFNAGHDENLGQNACK